MTDRVTRKSSGKTVMWIVWLQNDYICVCLMITARDKRFQKNMILMDAYKQELMSGEAAKERVTAVPSKSRLPTYFRFGAASAYVLRIVTYLAPGNEASARVHVRTYIQLAS